MRPRQLPPANGKIIWRSRRRSHRSPQHRLAVRRSVLDPPTSAVVLPQHADEYCSERPVLLAVGGSGSRAPGDGTDSGSH